MFQVFDANDADSLWFNIAEHYKAGALNDAQPSRIGMTSEILRAALSIQEPRQRWIRSRLPCINIAFALVETVWIMRGRRDSAFLNYFNGALPQYAGNTENYHGAYGYRLRNVFEIDQLERAYSALRHNPDSRQVVLQIWNPCTDMPNELGIHVAEDVPCNVSSILKVRHGKLEWLQVMRSNDFFRGLPYNIVQFTTIQEVLAGWLGLEVGSYNHISDSLHVYADAEEFIRSANKKSSVINSDNIAVTKEQSDRNFLSLEHLIENIIRGSWNPEQLKKHVFALDLLEGYKNKAFIISAEAARRMGRVDIACSLAHECSNPALSVLFDDWLVRLGCK